MANTNYNDFTTPAVNAAWLNDTNRLIYLLAGDGVNAPMNDSDVKTNLGITSDIAAGDAATLAAATALPGKLLNVQVFASPGGATYTPTAGTVTTIVLAVGAGGGGGGCGATAAGQVAVGGGGQGGSWVMVYFPTAIGSQAVTIGSGGLGAVGAGSAGTGGTTSVGSLISCPGGGGGQSLPSAVPPLYAAPGATTVAPTFTGSLILGSQVSNGDAGIAMTLGSGSGGSGGIGLGGAAGGASVFNTNGLGQFGAMGAGGSGAHSVASQPARNGGNGAHGRVVVYEYS